MAGEKKSWSSKKSVTFVGDNGYSNNLDDRIRGMAQEVVEELYAQCGRTVKGRSDYAVLPPFDPKNRIVLTVTVEQA